MPISPAERRAKIREDAAPTVDAFFKQIDAMLSSEMKREYWFDIRNMSGAVVQIVTEKYESIGWDVSVTYDQRDGNALVFKERK